MRFYLNSILSDSESRKIFYFLTLNLVFMLVQMLYGVWTNSLGLISDGQLNEENVSTSYILTSPTAIHMAFDCLAIGVGLIASIMAKWPPDERFTYGWVAFLVSSKNIWRSSSSDTAELRLCQDLPMEYSSS